MDNKASKHLVQKDIMHADTLFTVIHNLIHCASLPFMEKKKKAVAFPTQKWQPNNRCFCFGCKRAILYKAERHHKKKKRERKSGENSSNKTAFFYFRKSNFISCSKQFCIWSSSIPPLGIKKIQHYIAQWAIKRNALSPIKSIGYCVVHGIYCGIYCAGESHINQHLQYHCNIQRECRRGWACSKTINSC